MDKINTHNIWVAWEALSEPKESYVWFPATVMCGIIMMQSSWQAKEHHWYLPWKFVRPDRSNEEIKLRTLPNISAYLAEVGRFSNELHLETGKWIYLYLDRFFAGKPSLKGRNQYVRQEHPSFCRWCNCGVTGPFWAYSMSLLWVQRHRHEHLGQDFW